MPQSKAAAIDLSAGNESDGLDQSDELTAALLNATIEVFADRGYEGARVADIAARAGVTTGAVYTRFSGKGALLLAAFDQESGDLLDVLAKSNVPTADILAALGIDLLVEDHKSSSLLLESFAAARRDQQIADRLRHRLAGERARLAKLVDEEKSNGTMDPDVDTASMVMFSQAVGIGLQLLRLIEPDMPSADDWDQLLHRVIGSVATDSPPGSDSKS